MLKNAKRFVETFKNYTSYIHPFSLTDNFQNSRKKGEKRKKTLEAVSSLLEVYYKTGVLKNFVKFTEKYPLSDRSSFSEVFLRKDVLKICSKFTGEYPYRSAILIKLQSTGAFLWLLGDFWEHLFLKNSSGGCFCR